MHTKGNCLIGNQLLQTDATARNEILSSWSIFIEQWDAWIQRTRYVSDSFLGSIILRQTAYESRLRSSLAKRVIQWHHSTNENRAEWFTDRVFITHCVLREKMPNLWSFFDYSSIRLKRNTRPTPFGMGFRQTLYRALNPLQHRHLYHFIITIDTSRCTASDTTILCGNARMASSQCGVLCVFIWGEFLSWLWCSSSVVHSSKLSGNFDRFVPFTCYMSVVSVSVWVRE